MRKTYCLFRDDIGDGPVVGIQDCFGKAFLQRSGVKVGHIYSSAVKLTTKSMQSIGQQSNVSPYNFKVLAPADPKTIKAILSDAGRGHLRLKKGPWWEIHCD